MPESVPNAPRTLTFNQGDKVRVTMDIETLKGIQEGHGGWNARMEEVFTNFFIVYYLFILITVFTVCIVYL